MHNAIKLVLIGLATGVFGGLFGIGGGVLMVPALVFLMGFDQRRAVGTTPIAMLPAATAGLISYALQGGFDWRAAIALSIGVIVGARIGLRLQQAEFTGVGDRLLRVPAAVNRQPLGCCAVA